MDKTLQTQICKGIKSKTEHIRLPVRGPILIIDSINMAIISVMALSFWSAVGIPDSGDSHLNIGNYVDYGWSWAGLNDWLLNQATFTYLSIKMATLVNMHNFKP